MKEAKQEVLKFKQYKNGLNNADFLILSHILGPL